MGIREYSPVRIRRLLRPSEAYDGWRLNSRPPNVGDEGIVVDVLNAPGAPDTYVYVVESRECIEPGGAPIWLGEFSVEELEPLDT
jgi:hypothetical protein